MSVAALHEAHKEARCKMSIPPKEKFAEIIKRIINVMKLQKTELRVDPKAGFMPKPFDKEEFLQFVTDRGLEYMDFVVTKVKDKKSQKVKSIKFAWSFEKSRPKPEVIVIPKTPSKKKKKKKKSV